MKGLANRAFRPVSASSDPSGGRTAARGYPNCEEGWLDLLERCSTKIEATVVDGRRVQSPADEGEIWSAPFYRSGDLPGAANAKVDKAIALAAAGSACTCETRGADAASATATTGSRSRASNMPKANSSLSCRDSRTSTSSGPWRRPVSDRVVPPIHPRDQFLRPRRSEVPRNRGVVEWRVMSAIGGLI